MENLKLNKKNTFKIAFAFFGILMLWQAYNFYCPLILKALLQEKGTSYQNFIIGIIMALDNVVAIIVMPIVGRLSDKTNTKWGKRMPYIILGMLITIVVFPLIALFFYFDSLIGVIIAMLLFLIVMQAYRSPAVAFMPDITPKPLRATANGIINLIGYFGAVFVAILGMLPFLKITNKPGEPFTADQITSMQSTVLIPFIICTVVLIGVLVFLVITVKENKMLKETEADVAKGEALAETNEQIKENNVLSKVDKFNFYMIIIAIFFWFMSFNSFETFGSTFSVNVLGNSGIMSTMTIILTVTSIISFVAFSSLSNKIGRKLTIVIGLALLIVSLSAMGVVSLVVDFSKYSDGKIGSWPIFFYLMAAILGTGWALVNINSFPMIVEFSNKENIGRFTGYYYSSSMLAQSITPVLIGIIMDDPFGKFGNSGLKLLFVYASIMMIVALVIFLFVKEKITLKERRAMHKEKKSALENLGDID